MRSKNWQKVFGFLACLALSAGGLCGQVASGPVRIDIEQAIRLAIDHNHALRAARTQIQQSQAEEITAAIRPNPVFTYDDLFVPIFTPGALTATNLNNITEFDGGISYTFERGRKRQARIRAAQDQTRVVRSGLMDNQRTLTFSVAQQFVGVLLAKSSLDFAQQDLASFEQTVKLSEERYRAGAIGEGDLLKIKLQLLQFQTDVASARLALVQSRVGLRQLLGFDTVPMDYDVVGELAYTPLRLNQEDLQLLALKQRPDFLAAQQAVTAAQSQYLLAKANGKRNLTTTLDYTHVSAVNSASFTMNIELPIFDRNQGEIARTNYAIEQSRESAAAAQDTVMTDVADSYQGLKSADEVVQLYLSGSLKQAQDSRDISEYAYQRGAASLLDFLDAERSYRATQLAYRQALAGYMVALEQLREAVGTRNVP